MEGKTEKLLRDIGRRIDDFIEEFDGATENIQEELKDRYEELKKSKESLEKDFHEFKEKHSDTWDDIESKMEKAGQEVKEAFKKTFNKKDENQ